MGNGRTRLVKGKKRYRQRFFFFFPKKMNVSTFSYIFISILLCITIVKAFIVPSKTCITSTKSTSITSRYSSKITDPEGEKNKKKKKSLEKKKKKKKKKKS